MSENNDDEMTDEMAMVWLDIFENFVLDLARDVSGDPSQQLAPIAVRALAHIRKKFNHTKPVYVPRSKKEYIH